MSGLTIKITAILLVNIMVVHGKKYQKDIYMKDGDHVEGYRVLYSDADSSDSIDNAAFNIVGWKTKIDRPNFVSKMDVPDWFSRRSGDDIEQSLGYEKRKIGDGVPGWFRRHPDDDDNFEGSYFGTEDTRRWPEIKGVPDWYPDDNDGGQGSEFGRGPRWPGDSGLPDWFPRLPDDNNGGNEEAGSGQKHPGDKSDCQNIKGLPNPESGCCGVQLKDFPNKWWPPRDARFRRSTDSDLKPDQMIIGGMPTKIHQLPWMARILIDSYVPDFGTPKGCGGSIISSRYVLTAAHCVYNTFKELRQVKVFLSEYDTSTFPEDCVDGQCIRNVQMQVDHVVIHPRFNHTHLQNDVALLRLKSEIPYTDFIRPICLPNTDIKDLSDKPIIIAGWGYNGAKETNLKRSAFINYVKDDVCKSHYSYKDAGMFCSIGGNGEDICHGDSGGPLMVMNDNRFFLSGVVNGKRQKVECGSSLPSLFNNVFYHLEWIKKNVK